jgi:hypothetical protein
VEQEKTDKGEELLESLVEKVVNESLKKLTERDNSIAVNRYAPEETQLLTNLALDLFRVLGNCWTPDKPEEYARYVYARDQVKAIAKNSL